MTGARSGYRMPRRRRGDGRLADDHPVDPAAETDRFDRTGVDSTGFGGAGLDGIGRWHLPPAVVGRAGARLGSGAPRRREPGHAADGADGFTGTGDADGIGGAGRGAAGWAEEPEVGLPGARLGRLGARRRPVEPDPVADLPEPAAGWLPGRRPVEPAHGWPAPERGPFAEPVRGEAGTQEPGAGGPTAGGPGRDGAGRGGRPWDERPRGNARPERLPAERAASLPPPDRAAFPRPHRGWREVDGMDIGGGYDGGYDRDGYADRPDDPTADRTTLVRPYIRTGGRTRGPANLGIETLVSVSPGRPPAGQWSNEPDYRMVVDLCRSPRSVAEIAALASLPLGVARVLLADMARVGVIRIHKNNTSSSNGAPDLALMQRVLAGLRRL